LPIPNDLPPFDASDDHMVKRFRCIQPCLTWHTTLRTRPLFSSRSFNIPHFLTTSAIFYFCPPPRPRLSFPEEIPMARPNPTATVDPPPRDRAIRDRVIETARELAGADFDRFVVRTYPDSTVHWRIELRRNPSAQRKVDLLKRLYSRLSRELASLDPEPFVTFNGPDDF